jgi:hypothetical protein
VAAHALDPGMVKSTLLHVPPTGTPKLIPPTGERLCKIEPWTLRMDWMGIQILGADKTGWVRHANRPVVLFVVLCPAAREQDTTGATWKTCSDSDPDPDLQS